MELLSTSWLISFKSEVRAETNKALYEQFVFMWLNNKRIPKFFMPFLRQIFNRPEVREQEIQNDSRKENEEVEERQKPNDDRIDKTVQKEIDDALRTGNRDNIDSKTQVIEDTKPRYV